jgi:acetolactate synthase I/II/III large subunit
VKQKVADFLISYLGDKVGVSEIFVVYGSANGDLIDAFTRVKSTKYIAVMHEQAGGFAAECWAKVTGKIGAAIATSGPGGGNFVTPIQNCFYDSTPVLFITGQIHSQFLRPDPDIRQIGFQETDIVSTVKPITKYAAMITKAEDVKYELEKALYLASEGRPGPVLLDIPLNIQKQEVEVESLVGFDRSTVRPIYASSQVDLKMDMLLEDLKKARRPVMLIGMGVRIANAVSEFRRVASRLRIPCFPTWNAFDVVTSDFPYYGGRVGTYGGKGRNFGIQNADLLIGIGTRLSGRITGGNLKTFARSAKKYVVDVDEALLQPKLQQVPFDVSVLCDAKAYLEMLEDRLREVALPDYSEWVDQVLGWRDKYDPVLPEYRRESLVPVNPYYFFRTLSEEMNDGDILVGDCGGNIVLLGHAFETKHGQRVMTNNGNSPMGFSFAGAIGAWFASDKQQNVVCTIGDGGFNMNIQELQTLKNYGVRLKTFIVNNHIYGITKAFQETNFQGRAEACGPVGYTPPDFVKIAEAYGVRTHRITRNADVRRGIKDVLAEEGSIVCDVDCHDWHFYEPRIFGWATPIEDMYPYLPRDEFRRNMAIPPVEGWEKPAMPDIVVRPKMP